MATLARGLWLPLYLRLIEDSPGYLCFAGASLWILRQLAEMLIDACETRHVSEARMRTPKNWTLLASEIRPWDASHCRFPQEHMELACSGRNHLWLTVTSKAGDVELHTAAFSLDDLIEAITRWLPTRRIFSSSVRSSSIVLPSGRSSVRRRNRPGPLQEGL